MIADEKGLNNLCCEHVKYNPHNKVIQCHNCGRTIDYPGLPELKRDRERLEWRNEHPEFAIYSTYDHAGEDFGWVYHKIEKNGERQRSQVYSTANEAIDAAMEGT